MKHKFSYFLVLIILFLYIFNIDSILAKTKNFNAIFQGKKLNVSTDNSGNMKGKFGDNSRVRIFDSKQKAKNSNLAYLGKFISLKNLKSNSDIIHKKHYIFANSKDFNKIITYLNDSRI